MTPLLTVREVAERLGYSRATILRWTDAGRLPGFRMPDNQLRYREEDLREWIGERATPTENSGSRLAEAPPVR